MTNTGTGIQGRKPLQKRFTAGEVRDWLRIEVPNLDFTSKMILLNKVEQYARHYFIQGGGNDEEFEKLFEGR